MYLMDVKGSCNTIFLYYSEPCQRTRFLCHYQYDTVSRYFSHLFATLLYLLVKMSIFMSTSVCRDLNKNSIPYSCTQKSFGFSSFSWWYFPALVYSIDLTGPRQLSTQWFGCLNASIDSMCTSKLNIVYVFLTCRFFPRSTVNSAFIMHESLKLRKGQFFFYSKTDLGIPFCLKHDVPGIMYVFIRILIPL